MWFHSTRSTRPTPTARWPRSWRSVFRPRLQLLEDRTQPSTLTWINPAGGDWNTAANWQEQGTGINRVPGAADDAVIDLGANDFTVTHSSGNDTVHSLTDRAAFTLSGGSLEVVADSTVDSSFTLSSTLKTGATFTVTGPFTSHMGKLFGVGGTGRLVAAGGAALSTPFNQFSQVADGFTLELPAGTVNTWSGGKIYLTGGGRFTNAGTLAVTDAVQPIYIDSEPTSDPFVNTGTITVDVSGNAFFNLRLVNSGTIHLRSGTLSVGGDFTGQLLGDPGTTINWSGSAAAGSAIDGDRVALYGGTVAGYYRANATTLLEHGGPVTMTSTVAGIGELRVENSLLDLSQATLDPGVTTLPSFFLTGGLKTGATFTVTGPFTSHMGKLFGVGGTGRLVAAGGAALSTPFNQFSQVADGFTLELPAGTVNTWSGGKIYLTGGGRFTNAGTLAVTDAVQPIYIDSEPTSDPFVNTGTITVDVSGIAQFSLAVVNSGTIRVHAGSLGISGGNHTGQMLGDPGTTIGLGSVTATAGSVIDGDHLRLGGGTYAGYYRANDTTVPEHSGTVTMSGTIDKLGPLVINAPGVLDMSAATLNPDATTLPSLTLNGSVLKTGATFTVTGLFHDEQGRLFGVGGAGRLIAAGGASLSAPSTNGVCLLSDGFTLELPAGTASTWTGGSIGLASGSRLLNAGTLAITEASKPIYIYSDPGPAPFVNSGTITVDVAGIAQFSLAVVNSGTIRVHAGSLGISGGNHTGQMLGDPGTTIGLGSVTATAGSVIDGDHLRLGGGTYAGYYRANDTTVPEHSGTVTMSGTIDKLGPLVINAPGVLDMSAATLNPDATNVPSLVVEGTLRTGATFTVAGPFFLSGVLAGVGGSGHVVAQGGTTLIGATNGLRCRIADGFTLELPAGTSNTWNGSTLNLSAGGVLINAGTLALATAGYATLSGDLLPARFVNTGTVTVNVGDLARFPCNMFDSGLIALQAGTLVVGGPGNGYLTDLTAGQVTGAAGTGLLIQSAITAPAGSVIDGDWVGFANGGTIAGFYRARTATQLQASSDLSLTGEVAGLGALDIVAGVLDLSAATLDPAATTLPSMTLVGGLKTGATFTVTGAYSQSGVLMGSGGSGRLIAAGGAALFGRSNYTPMFDAITLELPAGTSSSLTAIVTLVNNATMQNAGTLTMNTANYAYIASDGRPTTMFRNTGTVTAAGGSGEAWFSIETVNDGLMAIQTGTLVLGEGGSDIASTTVTGTGRVTGAAGTIIRARGPLAAAAGSVIDGDTVQFANGLVYGLDGTLGTQSASVTGATIQISGSLTLDLGAAFTSTVDRIHIVVDSTNSLSGAFTGLPEGSTIAVGGYEFRISYANGDVTLTTLTVPYHATTTTLAASAPTPLFGVDGVTLTATVAAPGGGTPTGTVTFYDGTTALGTASLIGGVATLALGSIDLAVGSHALRAVYGGDGGFLGSESTAEVNVLAPATVQGLVWADFNDDGDVNFGEQAISGATVTLTGFDDRGSWVCRTTQTDAQGIYAYTNLRPSGAAGFVVSQEQPAGFVDGRDSLGTIGGSIVGSDAVNDAFSGIVLPAGELAEDYNFGERPSNGGSVTAGQTATIGFWQNKNGQNLIKALNGGPNATQLGDWLAATFPNMYAALDGMNNAHVAAFYKTLFARNGQSSPSGPPKTDAQVMATALAVYVTNQTLAGTTAAAYGFQVTATGVGTRTFNVGNRGAAFGVANGTSVSVMDLLLAVNARSRNGLLYDADGNGQIDSTEAGYRTMANDAFSAINEAGGI